MLRSRMSKAKKARDDAQALDSQIAAAKGTVVTPIAAKSTDEDDELGADFDPSQLGLNGSPLSSLFFANFLFDDCTFSDSRFSVIDWQRDRRHFSSFDRLSCADSGS